VRHERAKLEAELELERKNNRETQAKLQEAEGLAAWKEEDLKHLQEDLAEARAGETQAKQDFEDAMAEVEGKLAEASAAMEQRLQGADQQVAEANQAAELHEARAEAAEEQVRTLLEELAQLKQTMSNAPAESKNGALLLQLDGQSNTDLAEEAVQQTDRENARWVKHLDIEAQKKISVWNHLVEAIREDISYEPGASVTTTTSSLRNTPRLGSTRLPHRRRFLCERVQHSILTDHLNAIQTHRRARTADLVKVDYKALLQKARAEALDSSDFVDMCGLDRQGRPVVTIPVANLNRSASDLDMVLRSMVLFLDAIVEVDYVLVLFLTERDGGSSPGLSVLQEFHKLLPRSYKKHVKQVFLVHASWQSKVYVNLIRPFVSSKVFKKVIHAERLSDLYAHIDKSEVCVPMYVQSADREM